MLTPYQPGEVVETFSRANGRQFWVRDAEESHFELVEHAGYPRRLTCYCDAGQAHAEHPDTEPECVHRRLVAEWLAPPASDRPRAVVNAGAWVD